MGIISWIVIGLIAGCIGGKIVEHDRRRADSRHHPGNHRSVRRGMDFHHDGAAGVVGD